MELLTHISTAPTNDGMGPQFTAWWRARVGAGSTCS